MTTQATRRTMNLLFALALLALLIGLLWPSAAHSEPDAMPVVGPRTAASLVVVSAAERAVTGADLEMLRALVDARMASFERSLYVLYIGAALLLGALVMAVNGGRIKISAGPLSVETGGPDAPK
jgi:hypothetical protein